MDKNLKIKIKAVLLNYLKTQFILVVISVAIVWIIMLIIPELHPAYEILIAILSYMILSPIMDYVVSPYLIGKKTKVSSFLLIGSFIVGITFFGIVGAILAVPIALVAKTIWEHYR